MHHATSSNMRGRLAKATSAAVVALGLAAAGLGFASAGQANPSAPAEETLPIDVESEPTLEPTTTETVPAVPSPDIPAEPAGEDAVPTPPADREPAPAAELPTSEPQPAPASTPMPRPAQRPEPALTQPAPASTPVYTAPATSTAAVAPIWFGAPLPDPIPPARRLTPAFAARLAATADRNRVDWALMLAVLRLRGHLGAAPADQAGLNALVPLVAGLREHAEHAGDDLTLADRAVALARYYHVVRLSGLVRGLDAVRPQLAARILRTPRIHLDAAGRDDVAAGRIDVRVLVALAYLAREFGSIEVSSLETGHRLYARPGVVSAHAVGRAVDITALGGQPVFGNQYPGGNTFRAVRSLLLLPAGVRPHEVISLLGLGGPSFALENHADHLHVGF